MALTTITGNMVSVNAIQGTLIADNAITAVHIATNAVSGTLIADNAITAVHIAQNSITVTQLADDCVESDKIADGVITTNHLNSAMISSQTEVTAVAGDFVLLGDTSDSNNLKKTPVSSIIGLASGTTINNNADNRVITGSGTANTLEGEANFVFDGTSLGVGLSSPQAGLDLGSSAKGTWSSGNVYSYPTGNAYIKIQGTSAEHNWIGIAGAYGATSGSANLMLQANLNNTSQQAGSYIGSEAQSATTADITFGKLVGGSTTSTNATKSEFMRIDSSGNVGIGTITTFSNPLTLNKAAGAANSLNNQIALTHTGASTAYHIKTIRAAATDEPAGLAFVENATERMRIDSSGNTVAENLYVTSDSSATLSSATKTIVGPDNIEMYYQSSQRIIMGRDQYSSGHAGIVFQDPGYSTASGGVVVGSIARGTMGFATSNNSAMVERMRINSSGQLLVGATSAFNAGVGIEGKGTNGITAYATHTYGAALILYNTSGLGVQIYGQAPNGALTFQVLSNGNVQNTNNSYGAISDVKLKENIVDANGQLDKIKQVQVRNYNLIDDDLKQIGMVAQELETIYPNLVTEIIDRDENAEPLETTTKTIKYSVFVPILIKSIQEQQTLIESLTTRLETLENA